MIKLIKQGKKWYGTTVSTDSFEAEEEMESITRSVQEGFPVILIDDLADIGELVVCMEPDEVEMID